MITWEDRASNFVKNQVLQTQVQDFAMLSQWDSDNEKGIIMMWK